MKVTQDTRLIGRFYNVPNGRGLNIYNPYFEAASVDAIYLLFSNPDPKPLFQAMRDLNMAGAIPAAFEKDPALASLVDRLTGTAKKLGRVSFVKNNHGKLIGYYAASKGLSDSLNEMCDIKDKDIVIMGAGNVVRGLLSEWKVANVWPKSVTIYNRGQAKLDLLKSEYPNITTLSLVDLPSASGNVFINATPIGSPWHKDADYNFTDEFLSKFKFIADVTFVPLAPPLIQSAQRLGLTYSPGWKMFLYQGRFALETILDIEVDTAKLAEILVDDFATNWQ